MSADEYTPSNDESVDQTEDFATLFEASNKEARIIRDSQIEGTIVSIGDEWIFVDVGGKSEGAISKEELTNSDGELLVNIGDRITAYVVQSQRDELILSTKMTMAASGTALQDAKETGIPVEGTVISERKGGYTVSVFGKQAFCPFSQIDSHPGGKPEDYIGKKFTFRVMEYSDRGKNIVLSRRLLLEEERQVKLQSLRETLKPGSVIEGTVQRLAQFGAFVEIGGMEGLIPMSELAWFRVKNAADILTPGQTVFVKVLDVDWPANRVSLSYKQTQEDPWSTVRYRYNEGMEAKGTVAKLMQFGAFVELEPGIEGLIHISNMGAGRKINHPKEVVSEGDAVAVKIVSVDPDAKRIGLELIHEGQDDAVDLHVNDIVQGTVDSIKDYGVFVFLPGNKSGLLHVSEAADARNAAELKSKYPVGSTLEVQIIGIDPQSNKISLSTRSLKDKKEQADYKSFTGPQTKSTFGTLGDLLQNKLKK